MKVFEKLNCFIQLNSSKLNFSDDQPVRILLAVIENWRDDKKKKFCVKTSFVKKFSILNLIKRNNAKYMWLKEGERGF